MIHQTNSGRASGNYWIPVEIYNIADYLGNKVLDDFSDAMIVSLYKNKGSKAHCEHYRGISLLSIAEKTYVRVIFIKLITVSEVNLPEAQCGFRPSRSTIDMI